MYEIVTYVSGPIEEQTWIQKLMGKPGTLNYLLNPQLYMRSVSTVQSCLHNFGVFRIPVSKPLDAADLDHRVIETTRQIFGDELRIGRVLISADHVRFTVERETETQ